jgi:hypothetical protein
LRKKVFFTLVFLKKCIYTSCSAFREFWGNKNMRGYLEEEWEEEEEEEEEEEW